VTEPQIISDPAIMMGKPVVRGTRITVEHLLRRAASGLTLADLLKEYPHLTAQDVQAAYSFAADLARDSWLKSRPDVTGSWQLDGPEWTTTEFSN
jgi:uncharacterized protein (DUF433 family)